MSQSYSRRSVQARRRAAPTPESEAPPTAATLPPARALLALAVVVAVVIAAGYAVGAAIRTQPHGPFANCHTAPQVAPHTFARPPASCIRSDRTYVAKLNTTRGVVDIVMPAGAATQTVNNFVVLAANGFYDGLSFHRAESWVVQGGDPQGDGRGGPGYTLPEEAAAPAWGTGSVGMARFPSGPINGSQFFIVRGPWPGGGPGEVKYNQFGTVLSGIEVVNQLAQGDRILSIDLTIQSPA